MVAGLAEIGEEAADVWSASVDGKSWGCPVDGRVVERTEDGKVKVRLDGWANIFSYYYHPFLSHYLILFQD